MMVLVSVLIKIGQLRKGWVVLEYDFEECIGSWVCATSHALRRALDSELAKEGITFRQWAVLAWLSRGNGVSQVELAEQLCIEAPTLAGILSRMERDGWLERTHCTIDRRKKRMRPTKKANEVWDRMLECCLKVKLQATDGLNHDELSTFKSVCARIQANLMAPSSVAEEEISMSALAR